jgi:hypothetical protein
MPEISRFYGIIIRMYFNDHNPPHFHAEYQEYKAEYEIQSLRVIAGEIPNRAHVLVLEWASMHRNELMNNWEKASIPDTLNSIEPLE